MAPVSNAKPNQPLKTPPAKPKADAAPKAEPKAAAKPAEAKPDDWSISPDGQPGYAPADIYSKEHRAAVWSSLPKADGPDLSKLPPADPQAKLDIANEWWKEPVAALGKQANKDIPEATFKASPAGPVLDAVGVGAAEGKKAMKDAKLGDKIVEAVIKKTLEETLVKQAQQRSSQGSGNPIDPKEVKGSIDVPIVPTITVPW